MALDDEPRWLIALISDTGMPCQKPAARRLVISILMATRLISISSSIPGGG